jgi:hypothetical protein
MKINLVGDSVLDRIGMALEMVRQRHPDMDCEGVSITLNINGEVIKIRGSGDAQSVAFLDVDSQKQAVQRERHYYQGGFLSKRRCGL